MYFIQVLIKIPGRLAVTFYSLLVGVTMSRIDSSLKADIEFSSIYGYPCVKGSLVVFNSFEEYPKKDRKCGSSAHDIHL
jgi:hypothetical protein